MPTKRNKTVYILSNSTFCAEVLSSYIDTCIGFTISGFCGSFKEMNKIFRVLKIDIIIIISLNSEFIINCDLNAINKPILMIGPEQLLAELEGANSPKIGSNFQFVSITDKSSDLTKKLDILSHISKNEPNLKNYSFITQREKEILQLILRGEKNKDIAEKLFLSLKTVENHRSNILKKTQHKSMILLLNELYKVGFLS